MDVPGESLGPGTAGSSKFAPSNELGSGAKRAMSPVNLMPTELMYPSISMTSNHSSASSITLNPFVVLKTSRF